MREVLEGSQAVARAVARCRPDVVCAYPISPQTHIVEALARMARTEELGTCQYINAESEFGALSVCIGSSAAGARSYTATASQGLLYMAEAVFNASGMGLPIVMTIANRAIGAPINIWNDQSDSLSLRDSGWLQLFAMDNQEAADLHVIAFAVAEHLGIPVMVCMDGFVLTHASDVVDVPDQELVDKYLPTFVPKHLLDPDNPTTLGTMAGPETFTETKVLQHRRFIEAIGVIDSWSNRFAEVFGRAAGGLVHSFEPVRFDRDRQAPPPTAQDTVVVAMGSVLGTLADTLTQLRSDGVPVRLVGIGAYRPFPAQALREAIGQSQRVVVIDRALELGSSGVLSADVRLALGGSPVTVHSVVAGLGGRPIRQQVLADVVRRGVAGELPDLEFCDLRTDVLAEMS